MAVVVIIGVMAGLAGPAMLNSFADARAGRLTGAVVNTYNLARARAAGSGRAQLVRFTAADDGGRGQFIAYQGNSSSCQASNWAAIVAAGCGPSGFCAEILSPGYYEAAGDQLDVAMGALGTWGAATVDVCYEPTGITFWRDDNDATTFALLSSDAASVAGGTTISGGFAVRVRRLDGDGNDASVPRQLIVPLGAAARTVL